MTHFLVARVFIPFLHFIFIHLWQKLLKLVLLCVCECFSVCVCVVWSVKKTKWFWSVQLLRYKWNNNQQHMSVCVSFSLSICLSVCVCEEDFFCEVVFQRRYHCHPTTTTAVFECVCVLLQKFIYLFACYCSHYKWTAWDQKCLDFGFNLNKWKAGSQLIETS